MRITPAGVVAPLTMKNTYGGDKVGQRDISILETNFNPSLIAHKNMGNIHVVRKRGVTNFPSIQIGVIRMYYVNVTFTTIAYIKGEFINKKREKKKKETRIKKKKKNRILIVCTKSN